MSSSFRRNSLKESQGSLLRKNSIGSMASFSEDEVWSTVGEKAEPTGSKSPESIGSHDPLNPRSSLGDIPLEVEHRHTGAKDMEKGTFEEQEQPTWIAENVHERAVKVLRSDRRGLLKHYTMLAEVEDPKKYPRSTKWFITFVIACAAVSAPMGSAIMFPALHQLADDLNTSASVANLTVALYMMSLAICPLWWSSFSETLGRRTIYIISFSSLVIFNIASSIAPNIGFLIFMRILSGGAAGSVQAVGAGTIADIWEPRERGTAMGIFYLGPLMGPLLTPVIGGVVAVKWGWRGTQWFQVCYTLIILAFLVFALPETLKISSPSIALADYPSATRRPVVAKIQAKSKNTGQQIKRFFVEPLKILLYLGYPVVLLTVFYASITFFSLYVLQISLQATYALPPYNFSTAELGLIYIPNSIGYVLASMFGGRWTDHIMAREAKKAGRFNDMGKLVYRPEDRMRENAWIAAFLYPAALVAYGWSTTAGVFWAIPLIINFFYGLGSMLIFSMATTMLTEFMPKKASSGVALNNFVRNICSSLGGVVTQPLLYAIGNGWLFTLLGIVCAASSTVIWAMQRFGPRWRVYMDATIR